MKVARYISKLVNDNEKNYETGISISKLLSRENLFAINAHAREGTGTYFDEFMDDMALARTIVSFSVDNAGRPFYNLDVVVTKYDGDDRQEILALLKQKYADRMAKAQNGEALRNPLPEVKL